jgi:hypothetical protein
MAELLETQEQFPVNAGIQVHKTWTPASAGVTTLKTTHKNEKGHSACALWPSDNSAFKRYLQNQLRSSGTAARGATQMALTIRTRQAVCR